MCSLHFLIVAAVLAAWTPDGRGAPETTTEPAGPPTNHWSLLPLGAPIPPVVSGGKTPIRTPIDQFVLGRLTEAGLTLAPEADQLTLLRRLSFDLIGLPPTPEELDAFVADPSPDAYEKQVERLLASPRYGERWARHWLDVARYTESQGFEYDKLRDQAWHYRDYVIRAFNEDKPYDHFMREQIAGDVLEPVTTDGIVGASLLVCGPWDEAGNSQANVTQKAITREEELEDLISVVGQTFLGLTINCARCHSHKFDPIPQEEYYRIKSVFEGVKHGERPIAPPAELAQRDQAIAAFKQQIAAAEQTISRLEAAGAQIAATGSPALRFTAGTSNVMTAPAAFARWTFEGATNAVLPLQFHGDATIARGRLQLPRAGAFAQTPPLTKDIKEKTLEACVALDTLKQGGGAAISIESPD
ncbi:MAG TPA: DUF1549 domain-containing protein, partial [Candidatus Dormibacteraeota bacterium]|nr:DUF1549 domain-containing protein [Candidatus Dormibacteraeota bacterium]